MFRPPSRAKDFRYAAITRHFCRAVRYALGALGADHSFGETQAVVMREVGSNVEGGIISNSGHCIMEEQPARTVNAISAFIDKK